MAEFRGQARVMSGEGVPDRRSISGEGVPSEARAMSGEGVPEFVIGEGPPLAG